MVCRKGVVILGSTGSVGRSTLDVIEAMPERFKLVGLAARQNQAALNAQIRRHGPTYAALTEHPNLSLDGVTAVDTADPLVSLALLEDTDIVVVATTGHAAIPATIAALSAGKIVALANKETVVAAGAIVMPIARSHPGHLRPVDSEHSAIWQCLPSEGEVTPSVKRILLTASGGPFRGYSSEQLATVTPEEALDHPTWTMGPRITIDSATLMNKGFERIEAAWLFNCGVDTIDIIVHPQSIVHSMVEYEDGNILAQLANHDMRLPIQYALTYPDRVPGPGASLSIAELSRLDFEPLDSERFPAPNLAAAAFDAGSTYPAVLSRADELAVSAFLRGRIGFTDIADLCSLTLSAHTPSSGAIDLESIQEADTWTTRFVSEAIAKRPS